MKYKPANREELKALCDDENIYLGDIDTSLITDMSGLFSQSKRMKFLGIQSLFFTAIFYITQRNTN